MKKSKFSRMKEFSDENEKEMNDLEVGEFFLYGKNVLSQKSTKEVGQEITYYQVVQVEGKSVIYAPKYDILEED